MLPLLLLCPWWLSHTHTLWKRGNPLWALARIVLTCTRQKRCVHVRRQFLPSSELDWLRVRWQLPRHQTSRSSFPFPRTRFWTLSPRRTGRGGEHGRRMALLVVRSAAICLPSDSNPRLVLLSRSCASKLSPNYLITMIICTGRLYCLVALMTPCFFFPSRSGRIPANDTTLSTDAFSKTK